MAIKRKTASKKKTGNTKAIIIVNGKPVSKIRSEASKKAWVTRKKHAAKKTTTTKKR